MFNLRYNLMLILAFAATHPFSCLVAQSKIVFKKPEKTKLKISGEVVAGISLFGTCFVGGIAYLCCKKYKSNLMKKLRDEKLRRLTKMYPSLFEQESSQEKLSELMTKYPFELESIGLLVELLYIVKKENKCSEIISAFVLGLEEGYTLGSQEIYFEIKKLMSETCRYRFEENNYGIAIIGNSKPEFRKELIEYLNLYI